MKQFLTVLAALSLAACATSSGPRPHGAAYTFYVVGDTPYDETDAAMLAEATKRIADARPRFVIHVGDYKKGSAPCDGAADDAFAAWIAALSPTTVFYTPGDNEWTDCDRNNDPSTGAPMSELGRLDVVRARFFSSPPAGADRLGATAQDGFPENQSWSDRGVRFVTLHVVGTANGRGYVQGDPLDLAAEAADARERADLEWLGEAARQAKSEKARAFVVAMQADPTETRAFAGVPCAGVVEGAYACDAFVALRAALRQAAADFGGPTLVVHGDTDPFTLNQDFLDGGAPNLWRFNAAGDAGVGAGGQPYGLRDVAVVTFSEGAAVPFSARALMTGRTPATN